MYIDSYHCYKYDYCVCVVINSLPVFTNVYDNANDVDGRSALAQNSTSASCPVVNTATSMAALSYPPHIVFGGKPWS